MGVKLHNDSTQQSSTEKRSSLAQVGEDFTEFSLQQGLETNKTFLSVSAPLLPEPITKVAFPPGVLLAVLTQ